MTWEAKADGMARVAAHGDRDQCVCDHDNRGHDRDGKLYIENSSID